MKEIHSAICRACGTRFSAPPEFWRSFFGFQRAQCPSCAEMVTYPLTNGSRAVYWSILVLTAIGVVALLAEGTWPLPGGTSLVALGCLLVDVSIKKKVSAATGLEANGPVLPSLPDHAPLGLAAPNVDQPTMAARLQLAEARNKNYQKIGIGIGGATLGVVLLIAIGFGTARTWTKVDVPEHPETFRGELFVTGKYLVSEDGVKLCWTGQDYTDCINRMIDQHDIACAGVLGWMDSGPISKRCADSISSMQQQDEPGSTVSTPGSHGHLNRTVIRNTRSVSNNDYRPAVTHPATCYFGFLGECR